MKQKMIDLYDKAISLGAEDFKHSKIKRFYVVYHDRIIHFGSKDGMTFIDHHDEDIRKAWIARHSQILNKEGKPVIRIKSSPSYWSYHILWN